MDTHLIIAIQNSRIPIFVWKIVPRSGTADKKVQLYSSTFLTGGAVRIFSFGEALGPLGGVHGSQLLLAAENSDDIIRYDFPFQGKRPQFV